MLFRSEGKLVETGKVELILYRHDVLVENNENTTSAEWNSRFYKDFDMKIKTPDQGYLQDIHWSSGLFGYFPTYSLGNLYAANLFKKMVKEIKDLEEDIKTGQFKETVKWLRKKIHNKGRTVTPTELIKNATGVPVSTEPFLEYLNLKFTKLYGL